MPSLLGSIAKIEGKYGQCFNSSLRLMFNQEKLLQREFIILVTMVYTRTNLTIILKITIPIPSFRMTLLIVHVTPLGYGCLPYAKNQHHSYIHSWYIADSTLWIIFEIPRCVWSPPNAWTELNRCINGCPTTLKSQLHATTHSWDIANSCSFIILGMLEQTWPQAFTLSKISVWFGGIGTVWTQKIKQKIGKTHIEIAPYQVFMQNFLCKNVPIFPLYIMLTRKTNTFGSNDIDKLWTGRICTVCVQNAIQEKSVTFRKTFELHQLFMYNLLCQTVPIFLLYILLTYYPNYLLLG